MKKKNLSTGVLLINLGTPDSPTPQSVRRYLAEFLWDKRIIDIFWLLRLFLLYCIILPIRSKRSAKLYQKIWTTKGSPLLVFAEQCKLKLAHALGEDYHVHIAMRYGNPSIASGIDYLLKQNIDHLIIVPLFPQYAAGTTGSVIEKVSTHLNTKWHIPTYSFTRPFFNHPLFIKGLQNRILQNQKEFKPDFILFSYHGLPVRHLKKTADTYNNKYCLKSKICCNKYCSDNHFCYRAQCFETTRLVAEACNLESHQFATAFQSRFGKDTWTTPDTKKILSLLKEQGVQRLSVICPSFVADCLETLEEINIQLRADWFSLGGSDFSLIPALNSDEIWIECLKSNIHT